MAVPTKSTRPLTYFSAVLSVTVTPATIYDLLVAYFAANRPNDLNNSGNLDFSTYRLINLYNGGAATVNYGDYTTNTVTGVPIGTGFRQYAQSYSDVQSIDLTQRVLCSSTGTNLVAVLEHRTLWVRSMDCTSE